jgi:hypothetical protein
MDGHRSMVWQCREPGSSNSSGFGGGASSDPAPISGVQVGGAQPDAAGRSEGYGVQDSGGRRWHRQVQWRRG